MKELGPDEGGNRLRHPDCRACKESERVNVGLLAENTQLKKKLAEGGDADAKAVAARLSDQSNSVAEGGSVQCDGVALAQQQWCGECGLKLSPGIPMSVWTGHIHTPVSAAVMDAAWGVYSLVEALRLEEADLPEARERVLRLLSRAGITEQAVRMYGQSDSPLTQQSSGGQEGEVEEGDGDV